MNFSYSISALQHLSCVHYVKNEMLSELITLSSDNEAENRQSSCLRCVYKNINITDTLGTSEYWATA